MPKLDLKDYKILSLLDMNARMPLKEIARKVGVSRQVAFYRIERMKKEGVILGHITVFDTPVIGFNWFRVLIRLGSGGSIHKPEICNYLISTKKIMWLSEVGGNWDLIVNFIVKDSYEFNSVFEEFLSKYGKYISTYETLTYVSVRDQSRSYLLDSKAPESTELNHEMKFNPELKIDEVDKKIIKIISQNSSLSNLQIATKIGISDKTVSARMKRMEEAKLILGYRVVIDPSAIGYESYMLFLTINNLQKDKELLFQNFLRSVSNVTFVVKHIGRWRVGMEVEVKNRIEFQNFLIRLRDKFSDLISDFETFPLFKEHTLNYFPEQNLQ